MSIDCIIAARDYSVCTSAPAYTVLLMMAERADGWGYCWPSIATIAASSRCHRASVFRAIEEHVRSGEIIKIRRGNVGQSNQYIIAVGMTVKQIEFAVKKYTGGKGTCLDGLETALTRARAGWKALENPCETMNDEPPEGRCQPPPEVSHTATGNKCIPVAHCNTQSHTATPPSHTATRSVNNRQITAKGSPAKKSAGDPVYAAWHTAVIAHWDAEYRATTGGQKYAYTPAELAQFKRLALSMGVHKAPIAQAEASISAYLRITPAQDKYLANARSLLTILKQWHHRILSAARGSASAPAAQPADIAAILKADDERRLAQLAKIQGG